MKFEERVHFQVDVQAVFQDQGRGDHLQGKLILPAAEAMTTENAGDIAKI